MYQPQGIALDPHTGRLFVTDTINNRVLSWPDPAAQVNGQPADLVIGQPNLLEIGSNNGGRSASSLNLPAGVAVDAQGNLYVADSDNNRVLEYNAPLTSGQAASRVFGQGGNFTTGAANNGGVSANSLDGPGFMALDALGNLYVADGNNNRVLEFDNPLAGDTTADHVFGQPNFNTSTASTGGRSAHSLYYPVGVAVDAQGDVYIGDFRNHRVLEYDTPLTSDTTADRVFGQLDFTHGITNSGGLSASSLNLPAGVAVDGFGRLYVADFGNNRVLEYDSPLTSQTANRVFGQPDFTENTANNGGISASSLYQPATLAFDAQNNLYVADLYNNRVLEYDWAAARLALPLVIH